MMINIGIIANDITKYESLIETFTKYLHSKPHYKSYNICEWRLPLMNITILSRVGHALGCRFDLVYYDEDIEQEDINNILYQCTFYQARPQPLNDLLIRLGS